MHSSTSSSEPVMISSVAHPKPAMHRRATLALVGLMVCVVLGSELLSRFAFPRISEIERRIRNDEANMRSIATQPYDTRPTVLLVGNSLLLRGLDYPLLSTQLSPEAHVLRYVIENTEYLDWYYGLHHIFGQGIRPSIVVLCLNLGQTISPNSLGEYSARHLFGPSEIFAVARDSGLDATHTSGLMFAHWSVFYASRATIRNFILNKADPPYAAALHHLVNTTQAKIPDEELAVAAARVRLRLIDELCRQSGVKLVLLVPPSLGGRNDLLASAATLEKVSYEYPYAPGTLGPEFFRADHYHLNEKGAALFTEAISRSLRGRILASQFRGKSEPTATRVSGN